MRLLSFLIKSMRENLRDWKILSMVLLMAPIYVIMIFFIYGDTFQSYSLVISNNDRPVIMQDGTKMDFSAELIDEMKKAKYSDGRQMLEITLEKDGEKAKKQVSNKKAEIYAVIPEDFSETLKENIENNKKTKANIIMYGDAANPKYIMAAMWFDTAVYTYVTTVTGTELPLEFERKLLENTREPTQFGAMVPGLLAISLVLLLFTGAASIIKEVDKATIVRLKISKLTTFEFLSAVSITQAIISIPLLLLAYFTAYAFGYRPEGSLGTLLTVGFISSFSIMAISLIVSSFLNTIFELMTVGSFPYFILTFFSGGMFPLPGNNLFNIGGHPVAVTDILPVSHTISAMNKVLNHGAGIRDVFFELAIILILTAIYFIIGVYLFKKKHMRTT